MNRAAIAELIPHAGAMCLLDEVVKWDTHSIHCRSTAHRHKDNPLIQNDRLAAVHLVEYAAQAVAVHGGLLARGRGEVVPKAGRLAGLRDVEYANADIARIETALDVHAEKALAGADGLIYRFSVYAGRTLLARGRLTVIAADKGR